MSKQPKEIYRYIVDDKIMYNNEKPRHPLYNKYIREDIVERIRLSAYASAYARIVGNLNKGKK